MDIKQTFDNKPAVRLRMSLWQMVENAPPFEELRACSILLDLQQTQLAGRFLGDQP